MPTSALYHWSVEGSPIDVLVDLGVVDQLKTRCASSAVELGGILLGHFDAKYTVITNFEELESEHRRGPAYTLSKRDEARLGSRLEARGRKRGEVPVGFFRSHLRPGLFLDEGDNQVISTFFPNVNNVALLVRPAADGAATGGFFFWEDGEINRRESYLPFPMSAAELERGNFPIVEPVSSASVSNTAGPVDSFANGAATAASNPAETRESAATRASRAGLSTTVLPEAHRARIAPEEIEQPPSNQRLPWPLIGIIAAGAAFGGYLIGTSGGHWDRFGSRPGDITLNPGGGDSALPPQPKPESPAPQASVPGSAAPQSPALQSSANATPNGNTGREGAPSNIGVSGTRPTVDSGARSSSPASGSPASALPTSTAASLRDPSSAPPVVKPAPGVKFNTLDASASNGGATSPGVNAATTPARAPAPDSRYDAQQDPQHADGSGGWQHFHPAPAVLPSQVAANTAPATKPLDSARSRSAPAPAVSSVYLEAVESGGVRGALGKIPLLGSISRTKNRADFTPPQAVRSGAPAVPVDLARELTGTLPVDLRLKVDSSGHVSSVEVLSHQTAPEFVRLAGDAAYDWQFEPARIKDKAVSSNVIAHFKFRPNF